LTVEVAVDVLQQAGASHADARLGAHLAAVQAVLGEDLAWLERTLAEAVHDGPSPGSDAARHLVSRAGKRVRPLALLLSAACFGPVPAKARELAVVAELVHSATLLHDDVIDEGRERRGVPAARRIWGNSVSVLGGDLLLLHALARTLEHAPELLPDLMATLRRLVDGEIVQLRGRSQLDASEATCTRILRDKTASLFAWSALAGARVAGASALEQAHLHGFGEKLGFAFQLVDDVLDYSSERSGKTLLSDLDEGKLTLPLVLAAEREPALFELLGRIRSGDHEPVAEVSRIVVESGACDEVRRRAARFTAAAIEGLRTIQPSPARALLERVALELSTRSG
jgi:octaprenyl-diphosphate synthase